MSETTIMKVLKDSGLTENESKVYVFLAKSGVQKGGDISKSLGMHKAQVYRILKDLQSKGTVESTLEVPMRFNAVPFEKVLNSLIEAKREEASSLEDKKSDILADWSSVCVEKPAPPPERFMVISGRRNVYSKILQMIEEAEKEILGVTTRLGIIRADQAGLFEAGVMRAMEKSEAKGRILTYISKENLAIIKRTIREASTKHVNIECRHVDLALESCLRLVVKDGEEAILFVTPQEDLSIVSREDTGLWINNRAVAKAFKTFFERLWLDAKDADTRIREVETGKPAEETIIIKEARVADKKFREIVDATKEEIIGITSPRCVSSILEYYPVPQLFKRGVKIRIMAPINVDNLEAAQKLSEYCQIKHVDVAYVRMVIVDGKHLFQFKTPASGEEPAELAAYFGDTLYTNDPCYAERMKEMLNDVWQRSLDIQEIKSEVWDKTLLPNPNLTSLGKTV